MAKLSKDNSLEIWAQIDEQQQTYGSFSKSDLNPRTGQTSEQCSDWVQVLRMGSDFVQTVVGLGLNIIDG